MPIGVDQKTVSPQNPLLWSTVAAALVMAVGMGFGRFAYTGVYPVMVHEGLLTVHDGTLAASANYAGYLLGALLANALYYRSGSFASSRVAAGCALLLSMVFTVRTPRLAMTR